MIVKKENGKQMYNTMLDYLNEEVDIEKLCQEFHQKIGKDKSIKIEIEEGDTYQDPKLYKYEFTYNTGIKESEPYMKITKGKGILHSYIVKNENK